METFEQKTARNSRVSARYDELQREGKHGHYETIFRLVREEVERERELCAKVAEGFEQNRDWVPNSLWGKIRQEVAALIRSGPNDQVEAPLTAPKE